MWQSAGSESGEGSEGGKKCAAAPSSALKSYQRLRSIRLAAPSFEKKRRRSRKYPSSNIILAPLLPALKKNICRELP